MWREGVVKRLVIGCASLAVLAALLAAGPSARAAGDDRAKPKADAIDIKFWAVRLERGGQAKKDPRLAEIKDLLGDVFGVLGYTRFTHIASAERKRLRKGSSISFALPDDLFLTLKLLRIKTGNEGEEVLGRTQVEQDGDEIGSTTRELHPDPEDMGHMVAIGGLARGDLGRVYRVRISKPKPKPKPKSESESKSKR